MLGRPGVGRASSGPAVVASWVADHPPVGSRPSSRPGRPAGSGRPANGQRASSRWAVLQGQAMGRPPGSSRQRAGRRGMWAAIQRAAGQHGQRAVGRPSSGRRACYDLTILCQVDIMTLISQLVVMYHADIASVFAMAGFYQVFGGPIRAARGTYARARATRQGRPSSDLIVV